MIKVAVLDDYQEVFQQIIDIGKFKGKYEFKVFNEPFSNESETIVALEDFEALFIMRERTPITKSLITARPSYLSFLIKDHYPLACGLPATVP